MDGENNLRVINGGAINGTSALKRKDVTDADLTQAENELRDKTKKLYKQIETTYWELGGCLWEIYDGVPGGYRGFLEGKGSHANRCALFEKWGYKNFAEYCEKEIGIMKRSAENLRYAYWWFEIHLKLPREVKDQIKALGRSKVYQLAGKITDDNVMTWINKAQDITFEELRNEIRRDKKENPETVNDATLSGEGDFSAEEHALPKPEEMHHFSTSLYDGQFKTWEAAFDRAKAMSKSEKIGHNLELICQDFLMNNNFTDDAQKDVRGFISKMESILGLKLIAIDTSKGTPVYGTDLLWMLVNERKEAEERSAAPGSEPGE